MGLLGSMKGWTLAVLALGFSGLVAAQSDGKMSDTERAKRDAEKVFSFIKFSTVRPAAAKPTPAPTAAKPAATPARASVASGGGSASSAQTAAAPVSQAATQTASTEPSATRSLVPAAPLPTQSGSQPASATTLPPASQPAETPVTAQPEPEPEPEPDEVPLKLVNYVAPEMNRQVIEAIGNRDQVVPVRFTVEPNGVVSKAEAREGTNRRLGTAASRAVQQWRFAPLPERRQVDVELLFKGSTE